jgi:hypothetical protein
VNLIARGGSINSILDMSKPGIGALNFVIVDHQPGAVGREGRSWPSVGGDEDYSHGERVQKFSFHGNAPNL